MARDNSGSPASAPGAAGAHAADRRPGGRIIVYAWGKQFVDDVLNYSLPALLAPGNLPYFARQVRTELVFLTEEARFKYVLRHPSFRRLLKACPARLVSLDDLIADRGAYGMSLSYALFRGFSDLGPAMTEHFMVFLNADFVLADGSLTWLLPQMLKGEHLVLSPSYCVNSEEVKPLLDAVRDAGDHAIAISPRQMAELCIRHRHGTVRGKTVNQSTFHLRYVDQFYWLVDNHTMIGHQLPIAMVAMRPQRYLTDIRTFWDYGITAEFCPTAEPCVLGDSDQYLMMELRDPASGHDQMALGAASAGEIAAAIPTFATDVTRRIGRHELTLHSRDLPPETAAARALLRKFLDQVYSELPPSMPSGIEHPIWRHHYPMFQRLRQQHILLHGARIPRLLVTEEGAIDPDLPAGAQAVEIDPPAIAATSDAVKSPRGVKTAMEADAIDDAIGQEALRKYLLDLDPHAVAYRKFTIAQVRTIGRKLAEIGHTLADSLRVPATIEQIESPIPTDNSYIAELEQRLRVTGFRAAIVSQRQALEASAREFDALLSEEDVLSPEAASAKLAEWRAQVARQTSQLGHLASIIEQDVMRDLELVRMRTRAVIEDCRDDVRNVIIVLNSFGKHFEQLIAQAAARRSQAPGTPLPPINGDTWTPGATGRTTVLGRIAERILRVLFGRVPRLRRWHHLYTVYRLPLQALDAIVPLAGKRALIASGRPSMLGLALPRDARVKNQTPQEVITEPVIRAGAAGADTRDLCIAEMTYAEMKYFPAMHAKFMEVLRPGGWVMVHWTNDELLDVQRGAGYLVNTLLRFGDVPVIVWSGSPAAADCWRLVNRFFRVAYRLRNRSPALAHLVALVGKVMAIPHAIRAAHQEHGKSWRDASALPSFGTSLTYAYRKPE